MPDDVVRVSDAERDHVVALLQEHFSQGRLNLDEFHERVEAAYASTTRGDLRRLTVDLPVSRASAAPADYRSAVETSLKQRVRLVPVVVVVAVLTGCMIPFAYLGIVPLAAAGLLLAYRRDSGRWPRWLVLAAGKHVNESAHHPISP